MKKLEELDITLMGYDFYVRRLDFYMSRGCSRLSSEKVAKRQTKAYRRSLKRQ